MTSIIKVDDVQDAAGNNIINESGDTITIGASGDTITIPSGATITNSGTATGFGGGKVGQVVQTLITTAQALSTTTSKIDLPNYTVAITPTAASSKILVEWYIMFSNDSGDRHLLYLNRDTTEIGIGTTAGLGELCTTGLMTANSNNYWAFNATGSYLDSPATTSATTYKFQINAGSSYTCHFNRTARGSADGCYISTMTATEILA